MGNRVYYSGEPPHIGWWNTIDKWSTSGTDWRWWNGEYWSIFCKEWQSITDIIYRSSIYTSHPEIKWSDYHPENARVPRIDPRKV